MLTVNKVISRLININYMIRLKNIHKSFNQNKALDDLCLEVNQGEIYGLLGANGAGKSTTMNLLLGYLQADSGSIEVFDSQNNLNNKKVKIGYIAENVNLYPYLSGNWRWSFVDSFIYVFFHERRSHYNAFQR